MRFIKFAEPDIGPEEESAVLQCLRSGWLTTGPMTAEFERRFSELMGGSHCLAMNSATSVFAIALRALGIGPGDEVISSPWTFSSPVMEIWKAGAKPVLVDIEPTTFNIDVRLIEEKITPRTKAMIVTHFAGYPADMDAVQSIAQKHGLKIIEDAAHALPTRYKGKLVGTLGSAVTGFSFYATKTITSGEGGMFVTDDQEIARVARQMRLHGFSRDVFDRYTSNQPKWRYDVAAEGHKANLTDLAAAIGIEQLAKMDRFNGLRRRIAGRYHEELRTARLVLPKWSMDTSWHLYVVLVPPQYRDKFIETMAQKGVGCSVHFIPIHHHSFWKEKLGPQFLPVADDLAEMVVSLPIHTRMTPRDIDQVIDAAKECAPWTV